MRTKVLLNAIIGDICGSIYEWNRVKFKPSTLINSKCEFTDDTVHTIAVAEALMTDKNFAEHLRSWSRKYPNAGYGGMMRKWINNDKMGPYNSYGNGSAMRVSACGWISSPESDDIAAESAKVTHNHPEGIKGSLAVYLSIRRCRFVLSMISSFGNKLNNGIETSSKDWIRTNIKTFYPDYNLKISIDKRRPSYKFDSTCQGSVPQSLQCVLEADSYEDAIKLVISMGGDADTMACIAGSVAGVIWEKPDELAEFALNKLPDEMIKVVEDFDKFIGI